MLFSSTSVTVRQLTINLLHALFCCFIFHAVTADESDSDSYYADYGKPGKNCDPGKNMERSSEGRCICKPLHTYVGTQRRCLEVSNSATNYSCDYIEQCLATSLGPLAVCGPGKKCECLSSFEPKIVLHGGKCYRQKHIGEDCSPHHDDDDGACNITIPNSICAPQTKIQNSSVTDVTKSKMVCSCADGWTHVTERPTDPCLLIVRTGPSPSQFDIQCASGNSEKPLSGICREPETNGVVKVSLALNVLTFGFVRLISQCFYPSFEFMSLNLQ